LAKRAILSSTRGAPSQLSFHTTTLVKDEEKTEATLPPAVAADKGLFGTGISELFVLPVGIALAIPAVSLEWFAINEETQLMACFVAFCVTAYTQGGDAIKKSLDESAQALLKEHNEVEKEVINGIKGTIEAFKGQLGAPDLYKEINQIREETYVKLNAVGAVKPKHDLKADVERMIDLIANEEESVAEKMKTSLMAEATAAVSEQFASSKALKKNALESAIAAIKGSDVASKADPVKAEFVKFFKAKATEAKKSSDAEEAAQKSALIEKMNTLARTEGLLFELDASGKPQLKA